MFTHFLNLITQVLVRMPSLVGSNWGGFMFSLLAFLLTQAALWRWGDMKAHWQRNVTLGFAIVAGLWIALFILCGILTVYDDHQNLVGGLKRVGAERNR